MATCIYISLDYLLNVCLLFSFAAKSLEMKDQKHSSKGHYAEFL